MPGLGAPASARVAGQGFEREDGVVVGVGVGVGVVVVVGAIVVVPDKDAEVAAARGTTGACASPGCSSKRCAPV